jgi:hypothetical protein
MDSFLQHNAGTLGHFSSLEFTLEPLWNQGLDHAQALRACSWRAVRMMKLCQPPPPPGDAVVVVEFKYTKAV